jgi:hypothetical protein
MIMSNTDETDGRYLRMEIVFQLGKRQVREETALRVASLVHFLFLVAEFGVRIGKPGNKSKKGLGLRFVSNTSTQTQPFSPFFPLQFFF